MGNKKIFARGYSASRAEKERQDKARENAGKRLWRFFLQFNISSFNNSIKYGGIG